MAIKIEGLFKDLNEYSNCIYIKISELNINRNLGIIKVKINVFMQKEYANKYEKKIAKTIPHDHKIKDINLYSPVDLNYLYFKNKNKQWQLTSIKDSYIFYTYEREKDKLKIPTFDLIDNTIEEIDFDIKGNQKLIKKKKKKAVKKIHSVKDIYIYKLNYNYLNNPWDFVYNKITKSLYTTFNKKNIKHVNI